MKLAAAAPFAFLLVSHDRYFLENATNRVVELNRTYADGYLSTAGPYSAFVEKRAEFLTAQAKGFVRFEEYRNTVIHETTDPEVVIVEYDAHGTVIPTGAPLHQTIIAVLRIRDGLVVSYRDYLNPLILAETLASIRG